MKTVIVTDSTAYLPSYKMDELNIKMIPLVVDIEGVPYDEEIDILPVEFYDKVRGANALPKTSQPSIGRFAALYESLKDTYDAVISIHLSSGISGTYDGAVQASNMVEGIDVFPFDTELSCYPQGFYVLRAAQMAQEGAAPEEILAELNQMKETMRAYFIVDDLAHLQRGGRLSNAQAIIGSFLQVKPILHFEKKVIVPFEKIRTRKKAMKRIADLLAKDAAEMPVEAAIIHANCPDDAEKWLAELQERLPNVEFSLSYFGPVIGTHLGEGALGLGWVKK